MISPPLLSLLCRPPARGPLPDMLRALRRFEVRIAPLTRLSEVMGPFQQVSVALSRFADRPIFGPDLPIERRPE